MMMSSRISCNWSRAKVSALFVEATAFMLSARSISSRAAYARTVARKSRRSAATSSASIVAGEVSRFLCRFFVFIFPRHLPGFDRWVEREQELVANVARERQPFHVLHYGVKLMPVDDEHATSVRQTMDRMSLHGDIAVSAEKTGEHFVVVTRDVNDPCALARFAENFLDNVVVLLRPVTAAAQLPDVDQIAHYIERFAFVLAQEFEQRTCIAAARAQMDVGNPRRAHPTDGI